MAARCLCLAMAVSLIAIPLAGCEGTVNPAGVQEDTGGTDTGDDTVVPDQPPTTFTLTVTMGDIGDSIADVTVVEDGKADALPVSFQMVSLQQTEIEVVPTTYAITAVVGDRSWNISVPVNDGDVEVPVPAEELEQDVDPCAENPENVDYYSVSNYLWTVPDTFIEDDEFYVIPEGGMCVLYDNLDTPRQPNAYRYSGGDIIEISFGVAGFETGYGTPR